MGDVKVRHGRRVTDFGDGSRLKSDLALYTPLDAETINEVVKKTKDRLSKYAQPIQPHDIATTTHFVMVEMNLRNEGNKYLEKIKERAEKTICKIGQN